LRDEPITPRPTSDYQSLLEPEKADHGPQTSQPEQDSQDTDPAEPA
jgi:hypothetical protein